MYRTIHSFIHNSLFSVFDRFNVFLLRLRVLLNWMRLRVKGFAIIHFVLVANMQNTMRLFNYLFSGVKMLSVLGWCCWGCWINDFLYCIALFLLSVLSLVFRFSSLLSQWNGTNCFVNWNKRLLWQQKYLCSFQIPLKFSFYLKKKKKRIVFMQSFHEISLYNSYNFFSCYSTGHNTHSEKEVRNTSQPLNVVKMWFGCDSTIDLNRKERGKNSEHLQGSAWKRKWIAHWNS